MMIWIVDHAVPYDKDITPLEMASERLKLPKDKIKSVEIIKLALDARCYRGQGLLKVYTLEVELAGGKDLEKQLLRKFQRDVKIKKAPPKSTSVFASSEASKTKYRHKCTRPVVVGFGPAGIFASLFLAKEGLCPLILERGDSVENRRQKVARFWQTGVLDEETNVQFGEGGAGTFSDGKLTVRKNDLLLKDILAVLVEAGAPKDINYLSKPHIGTDLLAKVIANIRTKIQSLGGEIRFLAKVTDVEIKDGQIEGLIVNNAERIEADTVFFGIGHSARDTYQMLLQREVFMEAKAFAVGLRIEHPQKLIDNNQYHGLEEQLPPASYALTYSDKETQRSCYSFCMCPGGYVIGASSEHGRLAINGMSMHKRDSGIANSALVVPIYPDDFSTSVEGAIAFQRRYEELAFNIGKNYFAPVQAVGDFLLGKKGTKDFLVPPTYRPRIVSANLNECLPPIVARTIKNALYAFDEKIRGFATQDVPLTGVEMRTSAPCRITRDKLTFVSISTKGLYPIGEGAGYAGGIMSAALDGLKAAMAFCKELKK